MTKKYLEDFNFSAIRNAAVDPAVIAKLRYDICFSRSRFARALGTDTSSITRWETGKITPSARQFARTKELANQCGVSFNPFEHILHDETQMNDSNEASLLPK